MAIGVVEFLLAGLRDSSGNPLAGGKIHTYDAGTTTPKATYTDSAAAVPEANPIILDANGTKQVFATGAYKFEITDADDVPLYTRDNLFYGSVQNAGGVELLNIANAAARTSAVPYGQLQDGAPQYIGTVGGTANAITLSPSIILPAYAVGQLFRFKAASSNTSTTTVNISSLGTKTVKKVIGGTSFDLVAGDIIANDFHDILYDGTNFILYNPLQAQEYAGVAGGSVNALTTTIYSMTAYAAGQRFTLVAANTNTSTATLNINGLGTKNITTFFNGTITSLAGGEIRAGNILDLFYDGTEFVLSNPYSNPRTGWSSNPAGGGTVTWSPSVDYAKYWLDGRICHFNLHLGATSLGGSSTSSTVQFELPITPVDPYFGFTPSGTYGANSEAFIANTSGGTTVSVRRAAGATFAAGTALGMRCQGWYQVI